MINILSGYISGESIARGEIRGCVIIPLSFQERRQGVRFCTAFKNFIFNFYYIYNYHASSSFVGVWETLNVNRFKGLSNNIYQTKY
jgi:hypothetical protein